MSISVDSIEKLHRILLTSALCGMTPFMERKGFGMVKIDWSKVPKTLPKNGTHLAVTHVALDGGQGLTPGGWAAYTSLPERGCGDWWNNADCCEYEIIGKESDLHWANGTPWDQTLSEAPWNIKTEKPDGFGKKDIVPWKHVCVRRDGKIQVFTGDGTKFNDVFRFDDIDNGLSISNFRDDLSAGDGSFDIVKVYELSARQLAHALRSNNIGALLKGPYYQPIWVRNEESDKAKAALEADIHAAENRLIEMKAKFYAMK